ncbi:DUF389 domain-containing protein [Candidatus Parcubacteria bacterium]|nr:DUF389 domain-containing protein [Patescibacteria group bacterium]MBU4309103.1 DUF389 domain-containing protein [Patescibacteria group bacterium]MBU4431949.1 DUF389 domain-containing protein [Patescibacteria group bacterium]MBU4577464.1 DUF389 domain-containing protein [Patescibacteria group bacterium]MCG2697152.1 DUF389 domain-containing protein [Candidatus Parcubacteria bacterium]
MFNPFRNSNNHSIVHLFEVSNAERNELCANIIESSAPRSDFYFLVFLSSIIVSWGVIINSIVLVIGGMLVTPLLSPILAISLGAVILNIKVLIRSIRILLSSFFLAVLIAFVLGKSIEFNLLSSEIVTAMHPSISVFAIAAIAGVAASFTWAKKELNSNLPGVAITVTLIPPLTVVGLALSQNEMPAFENALNVLLLNVAGIILGSLLILTLMKFYKSEKKVMAEIKEEQKM